MTFSILRIKRKRVQNVLPLDALLIDDAEPSVKRRRSNQVEGGPSPLLAPGPRGIFRFAETVPLDSFDTANKTRQDRISAFLIHPPHSLSRIASSASLNAGSPNATPSPHRKLPSSLRAARTIGTHSPSATAKERLHQERVDGFHLESKRARYRVIEKRRDGVSAAGNPVESALSAAEQRGWELRNGPNPPIVLSAADMRAETPEPEPVTIYDAVEEEEPRSREGAPGRILPSSKRGDAAEDDLMLNFVPMLQEYLSLNNDSPRLLSPAPSPALTPPTPVPADSRDVAEPDLPDEFVYDVYYRDLREDASGAGMGEARHDVGNLAGLKRIGELAGLDDEDILLGDDLSSEDEDEADQDSNEENDYRNDYPSSESGGSEDEEDEDGSGQWSR